MAQVPLLSGVIGSKTAEFLKSHPLNLEPVIIDSGISKGQFRAAPGAVPLATGPGADRGGIVWKGDHLRVMGTKLVRVAGATVQTLGDVGGSGPVWMDYSFDRLAIGSGTSLYYWTGTELSQVTDEDLGLIIDGIWIDGYFMLTDGTYVTVTELNDPTQVKPLKYGSAEEDPDPITGLLRYRNEAYVFGRHSIQVFQNVGGNGFPFITRKGATTPFGCVNPRAKCLFGDGFAFVGSARGDMLNVYLGGMGRAQAIGTRQVCKALAAGTSEQNIRLEARVEDGEARLVMHLDNESWCYLLGASGVAGEPVWYRLESKDGPYRLRNAVLVDGSFIVGDLNSAQLGALTQEDMRHFGEKVPAEFVVGLLYNNGLGGIMHSVELIGLPGRGPGESAIFLSFTKDGQSWSRERAIRTGPPGLPGKRMQWRPHYRFGAWAGLRFRFAGMALPGIAAVEHQSEGLAA